MWYQINKENEINEWFETWVNAVNALRSEAVKHTNMFSGDAM